MTLDEYGERPALAIRRVPPGKAWYRYRSLSVVLNHQAKKILQVAICRRSLYSSGGGHAKEPYNPDDWPELTRLAPFAAFRLDQPEDTQLGTSGTLMALPLWDVFRVGHLQIESS